ncbi:MAG: hypothetical protein ACI8RD_003471, partial [Bacillariaceae sp.]
RLKSNDFSSTSSPFRPSFMEYIRKLLNHRTKQLQFGQKSLGFLEIGLATRSNLG